MFILVLKPNWVNHNVASFSFFPTIFLTLFYLLCILAFVLILQLFFFLFPFYIFHIIFFWTISPFFLFLPPFILFSFFAFLGLNSLTFPFYINLFLLFFYFPSLFIFLPFSFFTFLLKKKFLTMFFPTPSFS